MPVERCELTESLAAGWDELVDRVGGSPWLRPGWISAWLAAFGGGAELDVFVERRDGRVDGVLPVLRRRSAVVSPTNWHTPEFGLLADGAESKSALAAAAFADHPRRVSVGWLPAEDVEVLYLAARKAGYSALERSLMRSPYISFDALGEAPEASSDSPRTPRTSTMRRRRRELEREGELRFDIENQTEHLEDGFRIEGSGWKEKRRTAIISRPETHRFYDEVAQWAAERKMLRLFFLRFNGRPIAFVLGLDDAGRLYYVKGGFDFEFRRFGPGAMLAHEMIEYARRQGLRSFEFLGGEEPWKLEWTTTVRDRRLFQAFAKTPAGMVEWASYAYGRPLAKRLAARLRR